MTRRQACFEVAAEELEEARRQFATMDPKLRRIERHAAEMRAGRTLWGCAGRGLPLDLEKKVIAKMHSNNPLGAPVIHPYPVQPQHVRRAEYLEEVGRNEPGN